jgi:hypothetical protein
MPLSRPREPVSGTRAGRQRDAEIRVSDFDYDS